MYTIQSPGGIYLSACPSDTSASVAHLYHQIKDAEEQISHCDSAKAWITSEVQNPIAWAEANKPDFISECRFQGHFTVTPLNDWLLSHRLLAAGQNFRDDG